MVITTLIGYLILQGAPTAQTAPAAGKAAATTGQDAQAAVHAGTQRELAEQLRQDIRAQIAGAVAQGTHQMPAPPAPPEAPRTFTIRGPNGEQTTIGMPPASEIIPQQAVDISIAFFVTIAIILIGLPLARAFARRMDRKSSTPQISNDVSAQLAHLNQSVDAIALEVERITEGQRFTTKLLSEQREAARQTLPSINR